MPVVYSCNAADLTTLVVQNRLNHVYWNAQPCHPGGCCTPEIMQAPRLEFDLIRVLATAHSLFAGDREGGGVKTLLGIGVAGDWGLARGGEQKLAPSDAGQGAQ